MDRQKKVMKVLIVVIFAVFMLSTGLVFVMYLTDSTKGDSQLTGENLTGITTGTGTTLSGTNLNGSMLSGENFTGDTN